MFSLNKSLAQLKSALVDAKLAKKDVPAIGEESTKSDQQQKVAPKRKRGVQNGKGKSVSTFYIFSDFFFKMFLNLKISSSGNQSKKGVVMIKNFPHGFYEKSMFQYFSQFGEVTRLKIARSKKVLD